MKKPEKVSLTDPETIVFYDRHLKGDDFKRTAKAQLTMYACHYGFTLKHIAYLPQSAGMAAVGYLDVPDKS